MTLAPELAGSDQVRDLGPDQLLSGTEAHASAGALGTGGREIESNL
jgi:hypothetical protein